MCVKYFLKYFLYTVAAAKTVFIFLLFFLLNRKTFLTREYSLRVALPKRACIAKACKRCYYQVSELRCQRLQAPPPPYLLPQNSSYIDWLSISPFLQAPLRTSRTTAVIATTLTRPKQTDTAVSAPCKGLGTVAGSDPEGPL